MKPARKRARKDREGAGLPPEPEDRTEEPFKDGSDICQQLMDRYAKSSAPQHRHLIAIAAATRAILSVESLPLTPSSYFAAAMVNLESASSSTKALSSTEIAALMSFLVILIPAVPPTGIAAPKAREAVEVLARLVVKQDGEETLGVSTVRSAVKCVGVLLGFCEAEDWNSVKLGFETLLKFSVDKRPKVRHCAQECLLNALKLLQSPAVVEKASKSIFFLLKNYIPLAVKLSSSPAADESKDETLSKPVEVLHMLNVVRSALPSLSAEVRMKTLAEVHKIMSSQFSIFTRHILQIIEAFLENLNVGDALQATEDIIVSLCSYVSSNGNPVDTVISAANLLKIAMDKLQIEGSESRMKNLPIVCCSLAGLLTSGSDTASQASTILKEVINRHVDEKTLLIDGQLSDGEDEGARIFEAKAIKAVCAALENVLEGCKGIPPEHFLEIISALFLRLGGCSFTCMKKTLLKLADLMMHSNGDACGANHLQKCIGSAVIAIGPEKMLTLFPVSLHVEDFSYTNFWLVPILKDYVIGSSLSYYMEHVVPLAKSFQQASRKVGKSLLGKDLKKRACDLWKLLTAFCRHPADTCKQFPRLAELLAAVLKKYSFMQESVALALKVLVNENKSNIGIQEEDLGLSIFCKEFMVEFMNLHPYSTKTATRNLKALASSSTELLQILSDLFIISAPGKRSLLKDAIGCLACVIDSSVTKEILMSALESCDILTNSGELQSLRGDSDSLPDGKQGNISLSGRDVKRCVLMELASCFVKGANQDLIESIFNFVKQSFQETNEIGHGEAYCALSGILEEHDWFCSSHYMELLDVLFGLKTPTDIGILNGRFACFRFLMVYTLEMNLEEENSKAFLILNEIILILKDAKEETRKAAYDILLEISSSLRSRSSAASDTLYRKLINMIMGYLSGSSPHISSGAVSALSVLLYKETDVCLSVPDLVPSLLSLLQSKAVEVIKAVLGFIKVLVSCMPSKDLQNLLHEVVAGIIPWLSVSRHHFRSKVTVILEILIRKCGSAAVELVIPEKYKGFLKTVLENRHNKTSKEPGTIDPDTTPADQHTAGQRKRKHDKMGNLHKGDAFMESKRRKRERKPNGRSPEAGQEGISEGRKRKRKHDKMGNLHEGDAFMERKRRKKERKPDGRNQETGQEGLSGGSLIGGNKKGKLFKVSQRKETGKRGNTNFRGAGSAHSRNRKPGDMNKKLEGNLKSFAATKMHKHKKFDQNRRKR